MKHFFGLTPTQVVFDVTDRKILLQVRMAPIWWTGLIGMKRTAAWRERAATFLNSVVPLIAMWETT